MTYMVLDRTTEITIKAILARCNGDREQAITYCGDIADTHPRIAGEYLAYRMILIERLV